MSTSQATNDITNDITHGNTTDHAIGSVPDNSSQRTSHDASERTHDHTVHTAESADGTTIAYEAYGDGPVAVVVGGAFCDRGSFRDLAQALGEQGLTGVTYDRRGRGDSGDTKPYATEREIEDVMAVIGAAGHGATTAHLHGISSGGALVLQAAAQGGTITSASVLEPPYRVEGAQPLPDDYIETLERLEAQGDREGIIRYFHTAAVGLPEEMLEGVKQSPEWPGLLALAHTVRYDGLCLGGDSAFPDELLSGLEIPVLAVSSSGTMMPFLPTAARAVAAATPHGTYRELDGGFHEVPAATLAPVIAEFVRG